MNCPACDNLDGGYCSEECADKAFQEAMGLHGFYPGARNLAEDSEAFRQEMVDAGRGHLVKP